MANVQEATKQNPLDVEFDFPYALIEVLIYLAIFAYVTTRVTKKGASDNRLVLNFRSKYPIDNVFKGRKPRKDKREDKECAICKHVTN